MDTRARTMAKRNLGVLLLLSAACPWAGWWPLYFYTGLSTVMAGHRAVRYLRTWTFRRHVHEPVATVLDNVIRPRTPSGQGLVHVDIPKNFRDRDGADIRVHVPMDWPATKEDMATIHRLLEQRLSVSGTVATWTLTGRRPYGHFTMPAKPPKSVAMAGMLAAVATAADTDLVMGAGPTGQLISFDLTTDSPHLLINAQSMAGKSELLAWLIGQFMRRGYGVAVFDAKFVSHMWLRRIPGVLYAAESEELHEGLLWLDGELLRRARFVSSGGDPDVLVPLVAVLEEMNGATNRLRGYWKSIEGKGMSPALTALANLANMGREMRVHILLAGQSVTAKATGGPEGRESFGGRVMGKATSNAWRMLAPQVRPIPRHAGMPGRWHLVVGDALKEFQAPFCDIKKQEARLIEWATGGSPVADVPSMMLGAGDDATTRNARNGSSEAVSSPDGISLRRYANERGVDYQSLINWRNRRPDFPSEVGEGANRTKLYDQDHLNAFVRARLREPVDG